MYSCCLAIRLKEIHVGSSASLIYELRFMISLFFVFTVSLIFPDKSSTKRRTRVLSRKAACCTFINRKFSCQETRERASQNDTSSGEQRLRWYNCSWNLSPSLMYRVFCMMYYCLSLVFFQKYYLKDLMNLKCKARAM